MNLSIITLSFNQAEFLEQTIKSVVSQNYKNIEYLIFDGGSTDGSVEIIKKYAKKYPKIIKWQSKKDKGQVDALNKALKIVTGDVIAYINSDDYYLPGVFQKVVKTFKKNPKTEWLVGNCQVTESRLKWTFTIKHLIPIHQAKFWLNLFNWINQPAVFLRKSLFDQVGLFNQKYHYAFDYDYWLRCSKMSLPVRLKQDLAVFRVHPNSKGSRGYDKQFIEDYQIHVDNNNKIIWRALHWILWKITMITYFFLK